MINKTITDFSNATNARRCLPLKIYIACLALHSKGEEHGEWINANQSVKALKKAAQRMLATSPAGAEAVYWTILKTEGFEPLAIDPFSSLDLISRLAAFIIEHGELGAALIDRFYDDDLGVALLEKAQRLIARGYHGVHPSKLEFVEHFFPIPPPLSSLLKPDALHNLITHHLFNANFFTLDVSDQLHVFSRYQTLDPFESRPLN